jgi:arylsulfatase A-like enzyme
MTGTFPPCAPHSAPSPHCKPGALSYNPLIHLSGIDRMRILLHALLPLLLVFNAAARAAEAERPNIVFILIDDMGWTDLHCFGSTVFETPNIDKLAAQGMKFTNAYAACTVCSPTRASILTGRYPARLHVTDWIPGHVSAKDKMRVPDWTMFLPLDEVALPKLLKPAGFASAMMGKWHLGGPDYYPEKHGFDINIGGTDRGQPPSYFYPYKIATITGGKEGEYITDRLTDEAVSFIEKNKANPFFLYLAHFAVHTPIQAKKGVVEKYKAKIKPEDTQQNATYAAMVESCDDSVRRIVEKLDELKLTDKTMVVFFSDNGGLTLNNVTSNLPLRAGKGSAYEGGVRVPLIVRWPTKVRFGSVCDTPVISTDFLPTFCEAEGVKPDAGHPPDGVSLMPLLTQTGRFAPREIYWHYPHYHPGGATPYGAVRSGDDKLVEFYEDGKLELYNLKDDLGEKHDLAQSQPEKTKRLHKLLSDWRASVGAQMPTMK